MTENTNKPRVLLQLGGSTVIQHLAAEQTGGTTALIEFKIEPDYPVPPPHIHEHEDEITYVIEGTLEVTIGDKTRTIHAGESIFKPRRIPHAFRIAGKQPVRFLETITPAGFEGYFRTIAENARNGSGLDRHAANELMARYGVRSAPAGRETGSRSAPAFGMFLRGAG